MNAIPTWSYTPLKRTLSSEDPFFQVSKLVESHREREIVSRGIRVDKL